MIDNQVPQIGHHHPSNRITNMGAMTKEKIAQGVKIGKIAYISAWKKQMRKGKEQQREPRQPQKTGECAKKNGVGKPAMAKNLAIPTKR